MDVIYTNTISEVRKQVSLSVDVIRSMYDGHSQMASLASTATACVQCIRSGGKILIAGNGGSAAYAQHIVGEFVSGFRSDR